MAKTKNVHLSEDMDMTGLTLQGLRYFLAVAEELSVTKAARRLYMAQPPLSQQIRNLERELGCKLFIRTSRGMQLTAAGLSLVQSASSLLGDADRMAARARASAIGDTGYLEVGCVPVACTGIAAELLGRFHRGHPRVTMHLRELDTDSLYAALSARTVDIGIIRTRATASDVLTLPLFDESVLIAMPEAHPLAPQKDMSLSDLSDERFILYSSKLGMRHFDEFVAACREEGGFEPTVISECDSVNAQLAMIAAGLGVGFVTELSSRECTAGVVFRELPELEISVPLLLAWPADSRNPVVPVFIEMANTHCSAGLNATQRSTRSF